MGEAKRRRAARMAGECCENCAFWQPQPQGNVGECHAGPPVPIPVAMMQPKLAGQPPFAVVQGHWPPTVAGAWCGAHPEPGGASMELDWSLMEPDASDKPQ